MVGPSRAHRCQLPIETCTNFFLSFQPNRFLLDLRSKGSLVELPCELRLEGAQGIRGRNIEALFSTPPDIYRQRYCRARQECTRDQKQEEVERLADYATCSELAVDLLPWKSGQAFQHQDWQSWWGGNQLNRGIGNRRWYRLHVCSLRLVSLVFVHRQVSCLDSRPSSINKAQHDVRPGR